MHNRKTKLKSKPYRVKQEFDYEHITDFLIDMVEEGEMDWQDAIRDAALSAMAEQWFNDRFDSVDLIGTEMDHTTGECVWDMQEDYQNSI